MNRRKDSLWSVGSMVRCDSFMCGCIIHREASWIRCSVDVTSACGPLTEALVLCQDPQATWDVYSVLQGPELWRKGAVG